MNLSGSVPGEEWRLETGVFEDKVNREIYLVQRDLWAELAGEVYPVCLFLAVNRQGDVFMWPVKLPGSDGRVNTWNDSALAAARLAETKWVRVAANMPGGHIRRVRGRRRIGRTGLAGVVVLRSPEAVLQGSVHPDTPTTRPFVHCEGWHDRRPTPLPRSLVVRL